MQWRNIPNILSYSRIILSFVFAYYFNEMLTTSSRISFPLILFFIIILTDFFDGYIARKTDSTTHTGALLDVVADFIFVLIAYLILYFNNLLSFVFIIVLLIKFLEFILTSLVFKKDNDGNILLFDKIGKNVSKFWIAFPGIICILYLVEITNTAGLILFVMSVTSILALISTVTRVIYQKRVKL